MLFSAGVNPVFLVVTDSVVSRSRKDTLPRHTGADWRRKRNGLIANQKDNRGYHSQ